MWTSATAAAAPLRRRRTSRRSLGPGDSQKARSSGGGWGAPITTRKQTIQIELKKEEEFENNHAPLYNIDVFSSSCSKKMESLPGSWSLSLEALANRVLSSWSPILRPRWRTCPPLVFLLSFSCPLLVPPLFPKQFTVGVLFQEKSGMFACGYEWFKFDIILLPKSRFFAYMLFPNSWRL